MNPQILPNRLSEIESHFGRAVAKQYNSVIEKLTHIMIRDSDMILTVSRTSARQLCSLYGITGNDIKKEERKKKKKNVMRLLALAKYE